MKPHTPGDVEGKHIALVLPEVTEAKDMHGIERERQVEEVVAKAGGLDLPSPGKWPIMQNRNTRPLIFPLLHRKGGCLRSIPPGPACVDSAQSILGV